MCEQSMDVLHGLVPHAELQTGVLGKFKNLLTSLMQGYFLSMVGIK